MINTPGSRQMSPDSSPCSCPFDRARERAGSIMSSYERYRPRPSTRELHDLTRPHIELIHCSSEGWLIPGEILHGASHGMHSFIVVQPFGCLPNHIFGRGVTKLVKDQYPHVQILALDFDPDTSTANIENRLQMLIMNARELEKLKNRKAGPVYSSQGYESRLPH